MIQVTVAVFESVIKRNRQFACLNLNEVNLLSFYHILSYISANTSYNADVIVVFHC